LKLFALLLGNLFFLPGAHLLDLGDVELQQVVDPRQEVLPKAVLATSSSSLHYPSDTVAAKTHTLIHPWRRTMPMTTKPPTVKTTESNDREKKILTTEEEYGR
jgi:hypothetical protein